MEIVELLIGLCHAMTNQHELATPTVNIDGTPMIQEAWTDIHGNPYGCSELFSSTDGL